MSVSVASAATILDGAEGSVMDKIREVRKELKAYFGKTVDAWKKASTLERTADNYDEKNLKRVMVRDGICGLSVDA